MLRSGATNGERGLRILGVLSKILVSVTMLAFRGMMLAQSMGRPIQAL